MAQDSYQQRKELIQEVIDRHIKYGEEYAKALEESKGIKIQRTGIIWLKAHSRGPSKQKNVIQGKGWKVLQIDEIEENFELFKMIYKLYSLENPNTEPIYNSYPSTIKL